MGFLIDGYRWIAASGNGDENDPYQLTLGIELTGELPEGTNPIGSVEVSSIAMPGTLRFGKVDIPTGGTAVQLSVSSVPLVNGVTVKAAAGNAQTVYVGGSNVTNSNGYELSAGQEVFIVIDDLNKVYVNAASGHNGMDVVYIGS